MRGGNIRQRANILGINLQLPRMFGYHGVQLLHRSMKRFGGAHQKFQAFVDIHIRGGQGRIRTFVPRKEGQIYSLLALTAHPPVQTERLFHS